MVEKKPQKAPSEEIKLENITTTYICSYKLDGIRAIIKDGQILSSTMSPLPNKNLLIHFKEILDKKDLVFDGEIYAHGVPFGNHYSVVMSHDKEIPDNFKFCAFDMLTLKEWEAKEKTTKTEKRLNDLLNKSSEMSESSNFECIYQHLFIPKEIPAYIERAKENGYEGIMLRNPDSLYKHGRASVKQNNILKYKFWKDYDAKIISVNEKEGYKEGIERVKSATGRTKATHKKEHKELKGTFGYFEVEVDVPDKPILRVGGWKGLTHELRDQIWNQKDSYIGRWIRFKSMEAGEKDLPRISKEIEFRDSK